jgi:hypothetical protein
LRATRAGGFFVAAINDALQGLERLAISAEDLLLVRPMTARPARRRTF